MKKIITLFLIAISFVNCSKDAPVPKNEKENDKGHDEPTRIELVFSEENDKTKQQKFVFELDEVSKNIVRKDQSGGRILAKDETPLLLSKAKKYQLEIFYYNIKNQLMNHEFLTAEQRPIHQHFFTIASYKNTENQVVTNTLGVWNYTYTDEGGDPVGLKGVFEPNIGGISFEVRVRLFHITSGNKYIGNQKSNGVYPFNNPADELLSRATTDLDQVIPVKISE